MDALISKFGWRLLAIPVEALANAWVLWLVLNRMVPPQLNMTIEGEDPLGEDLPETRLIRAYPFHRCLLGSVLLMTITYLTLKFIRISLSSGIAMSIFYYTLIGVLMWYFASSFAIKHVFRMQRGRIVILVLYVLVSGLVESVLLLVVP